MFFMFQLKMLLTLLRNFRSPVVSVALYSLVLYSCSDNSGTQVSPSVEINTTSDLSSSLSLCCCLSYFESELETDF
jgi:hypothetical protein